MARLTAQLLGGLRLECDGEARQLASARAKAVAAYLLLHRGLPLERAHLAYLLWPESDERQARTNLRQVLHQLRRGFPEVQGSLSLDGQQLELLKDASIEVDVERFGEFVKRAAWAQEVGGLAHEQDWLEQAADLYRGDLLPEMYDGWLEPLRESLRAVYGGVLERLLTLAEERLDNPGAVRYAQRLVQHDPLVEAPYRRLMGLHMLCGERAKALMVYHRCASLLQQELGVEPSRQTRSTYEELLALQAEATPTAVSTAAPVHARSVTPRGRFFGRSEERAALAAAWERAREGRASLALVTGEPGIGKTRLVEEFARDLSESQALKVGVRCYATEATLPLSLAAAIVRRVAAAGALDGLEPVWRGEIGRLLPELAGGQARAYDGGAQGWQRRRLFEALVRAVLVRQPCLVMIDDLPWCDRESLEWLQHLLRFDTSAQLLLIATARSHEVRRNEAFVPFLSALQNEDLASELALPALSMAETASLARSLWRGEARPEALVALFEETEGNPLFTVEFVRAGWLGQRRVGPGGSSAAGAAAGSSAAGASDALLPPKLRAVITSRFEQLSERCVELLSIAAVIGREVGVELLVQVSGWDEDTTVRCLDEMWQRGILREVGTGHYYFSHDKLREVAYTVLSRTRRRLLHQRVAETLERSRGDVASGRIANHFDQARLPERAIPHYLRAAEAARAVFGHDDALEAYERASTLLEGLRADEDRAGWRDRAAGSALEGAGDVMAHRGRRDEALERYAAALRCRAGSEPVARARILRKIGVQREYQFRVSAAAEAFEAAAAELGGAGHDETEEWLRESIELGFARSDLFYWQHDWPEDERVLRGIESAVMQHGTPIDRGRFLERLGVLSFGRGGFVGSEEALAPLRAALAEFETADDLHGATSARLLIGFALLTRGDLGEAAPHLREALLAAELMGDVLTRSRCLTYLGFIHRLEGDVTEARAYAMRTLEAATELNMPEYIGVARGHLAWLALRSGDTASCLREGEAAVACWRSSRAYPMQWCARLPLLAVRSAQGHVLEARAHAAYLLDPDQQRLPAALAAALRHVLEENEDAAAIEALEHVVAVARRERFL